MCGSGAGPALRGVIQGYGDVCGRRERAALLRPFDDADAVRGEQVVQTRIFPFFGRGKAVKVEMMERERFQRVGFDDGVGRAFDRAGVSESAQDAARERGFSRAQIALQMDDQWRAQRFCPTLAQLECGLFVGKLAGKGCAVAHEISLIVF